MSRPARLLRDTLEVTLARDDAFPTRFYERLFTQHPELRSMFHRNSTGAQHKMFAQKLVAIVDQVEEPLAMERELADIARSHRDYGVSPEMYAWVGEALIDTLREACEDAWSDEAEQAWRAAYGEIARRILSVQPR